MTICDIDKLCAGLAPIWAGLIVDWDRTLRAGNHPDTTRYNYLLAARQLALYLDDESLIEASPASDDPRAVTKAQVESFQIWMIETRSASTALNKHKALTQFFLWLEVEEDEIDQSPMRKVRQPSVPKRLIPIIRSGDTRSILLTCRPKSFINLRDEAIIRVLSSTAG